MFKIDIQKIIKYSSEKLGLSPKKIELRSIQVDAIRAIQKSMREGNKEFILQMSVGSGKTFLSILISKLFLEIGGTKTVLFLSPFKAIEMQLLSSLNDILPSIEPSIYGSEKNDNNGIIISTYHKIVSSVVEFVKDDFDLIIFEELHFTSNEKMKQKCGNSAERV